MKAVNSVLIIAILLFATVITWTYFAARGTDTSSIPQAGIGGGPEDNQTTNFRDSFLALLPKHGNTAVLHLTNLYDGKDTSATSRELEDNAQQLADVIKEVGTITDRALFLQSFRGHIKDYEMYTRARKENDQPTMNAAKENLRMHAMSFGDLTNKLMPTISEERAIELMNDHINLTLKIVDAHAKGDIATKLNLMELANAQAVQFANELGAGAETVSK